MSKDCLAAHIVVGSEDTYLSAHVNSEARL